MWRWAVCFTIREKFAIPPDDDDDPAPNSQVFQVHSVGSCIFDDDETPDGKTVLVAYFFDSSKPQPSSTSKMEWSSLIEVSSWITSFEALEVPEMQLQLSAAKVKVQPITSKAKPTPPRLTKRQSALLAKQTASVASAGCSMHTESLAEPGNSLEGTPHGDASPKEKPPPAKKKPKQGPSIGRRINFVFNRIVSCLRQPHGSTRYLVEYNTTDGVILLPHAASQLSPAAIEAYQERKKSKLFAYNKDEALVRKLMCGNNDKELQDVKLKRSHSAGIGAAITNCGIEVDVYELFGKESCSQVLHRFMLLTIKNLLSRSNMPTLRALSPQVWLNFLDLSGRCPELWAKLLCICYDDACHLKVSTKHSSCTCQRLGGIVFPCQTRLCPGMTSCPTP